MICLGIHHTISECRKQQKVLAAVCFVDGKMKFSANFPLTNLESDPTISLRGGCTLEKLNAKQALVNHVRNSRGEILMQKSVKAKCTVGK